MAEVTIEQIGLGVKKINRRRRKKKPLPFTFPKPKETTKVESKPKGPIESIEQATAIKPASVKKEKSLKYKTADIEIIYTTELARENGARSEIKFGDTSDGGTVDTPPPRILRRDYHKEPRVYLKYKGKAGSGRLPQNSFEPQYFFPKPKGTTTASVWESQNPIEVDKYNLGSHHRNTNYQFQQPQYLFPKSHGTAECSWGFQNSEVDHYASKTTEFATDQTIKQDLKDTGRKPNQFHKMNSPDENRCCLRKLNKEKRSTEFSWQTVAVKNFKTIEENHKSETTVATKKIQSKDRNKVDASTGQAVLRKIGGSEEPINLNLTISRTMQLRSGNFTREIAPKSELKDFKIHAHVPPKEKSKKTAKLEQDKISHKNKDEIQQSAIQLPASEVKKEKKRGRPKKSISPPPVVTEGEKKRGRQKISINPPPVAEGEKMRGRQKISISPPPVAEGAKKRGGRKKSIIPPPVVGEGVKDGSLQKSIQGKARKNEEKEAELDSTAQSKISSTTYKKNQKALAAKEGAQESLLIPVRKRKNQKKKIKEAAERERDLSLLLSGVDGQAGESELT